MLPLNKVVYETYPSDLVIGFCNLRQKEKHQDVSYWFHSPRYFFLCHIIGNEPLKSRSPRKNFLLALRVSFNFIYISYISSLSFGYDHRSFEILPIVLLLACGTKQLNLRFVCTCYRSRIWSPLVLGRQSILMPPKVTGVTNMPNNYPLIGFAVYRVILLLMIPLSDNEMTAITPSFIQMFWRVYLSQIRWRKQHQWGFCCLSSRPKSRACCWLWWFIYRRNQSLAHWMPVPPILKATSYDGLWLVPLVPVWLLQTSKWSNVNPSFVPDCDGMFIISLIVNVVRSGPIPQSALLMLLPPTERYQCWKVRRPRWLCRFQYYAQWLWKLRPWWWSTDYAWSLLSAPTGSTVSNEYFDILFNPA